MVLASIPSPPQGGWYLEPIPICAYALSIIAYATSGRMLDRPVTQGQLLRTRSSFAGMASISSAPPVAAAGRVLSKVPQVTLMFWVIKVLTTGMGEATSDYFLLDLPDPSTVVSVAFVALIVSLIAQIAVRRYIPWLYWTTVVLVSVVGTMVADILHYMLDVSFAESTTWFAVALAVVFAAWYATERTLSIHSINTRRREIFYWLTVMATFALGTSAGDLVADTANLGFLGAGILFAVAFAVPGIARKTLGLNATVAFWLAYIITRPLGASFADLFGMPAENGGLDLGLGLVSLVLTIAIVALVGSLSLPRKAKP